MSDSGIPRHEPTISFHEALRLIVEHRHPDGPEAAKRTLLALPEYPEPIPSSWFIYPAEYLQQDVVLKGFDVDAFNEEACRGLGAAITMLEQAIGQGDVRVVGHQSFVNWSKCRIKIQERRGGPEFVVVTASKKAHPLPGADLELIAADIDKILGASPLAMPRSTVAERTEPVNRGGRPPTHMDFLIEAFAIVYEGGPMERLELRKLTQAAYAERGGDISDRRANELISMLLRRLRET